MHLDPDPDSTAYRRFITHLTFFAERLLADQGARDSDVGSMLRTIDLAHPAAAECAATVDAFCERTYHHSLTPEKRLYLTIHIAHLSSASA